MENPDALYRKREDPVSAKRSAEIWSYQVSRDKGNYEAEWKLARARYWLGGNTAIPLPERKQELEMGMAAAALAIAAAKDRPEGHFWLAANMGALAESFGLMQGLKYRGAIRDELLIVLKIDPAFQQGSADRALGRWYFKVPSLFGGSRTTSEEHLRRSLTYNSKSTASHFFLAETLLAEARPADARAELNKVIEVPLDADWAPEDKAFKEKAKAMLLDF